MSTVPSTRRPRGLALVALVVLAACAAGLAVRLAGGGRPAPRVPQGAR